jgi:hypothetical protein
MQVPGPTKLTVVPEIVQAAALVGAREKPTGRPELAVAPTVYEPPTTAAPGEVVKVIDCALLAGTGGGFDGVPPPPLGGAGSSGSSGARGGDVLSGASAPEPSVLNPGFERSTGVWETGVVSPLSARMSSSTPTASETGPSERSSLITASPSARIAARASGVDA